MDALDTYPGDSDSLSQCVSALHGEELISNSIRLLISESQQCLLSAILSALSTAIAATKWPDYLSTFCVSKKLEIASSFSRPSDSTLEGHLWECLFQLNLRGKQCIRRASQMRHHPHSSHKIFASATSKSPCLQCRCHCQ